MRCSLFFTNNDCPTTIENGEEQFANIFLSPSGDRQRRTEDQKVGRIGLQLSPAARPAIWRLARKIALVRKTLVLGGRVSVRSRFGRGLTLLPRVST